MLMNNNEYLDLVQTIKQEIQQLHLSIIQDGGQLQKCCAVRLAA